MNAAQLHQTAMELAERAEAARRAGDRAAFEALSLAAFEKEAEAAGCLRDQWEMEPSRSVLHRSAACLALDCRRYRDAERLVTAALSGDPPTELLEELRTLSEEIRFHLTLEQKRTELNPVALQLSIKGRAVGFGIALSKEVSSRLRYLENFVYRTAERLLGLPFRDGAAPSRALMRDLDLYVRAPACGSYVVSIALGSSEQLRLPGMDYPSQIVQEIGTCLELFNAESDAPLRERLPDEQYFRNFVGLARGLAPDGNDVSAVAVDAATFSSQKTVQLRTPRRELARRFRPPSKPEREEEIEVVGVLQYADAVPKRYGKLKVLDDSGETHVVSVARELMSDIVRPLFEERVRVVGIRRNRVIHAEDIERA